MSKDPDSAHGTPAIIMTKDPDSAHGIPAIIMTKESDSAYGIPASGHHLPFPRLLPRLLLNLLPPIKYDEKNGAKFHIEI